MSEEDLGRYQMLWDCPACGSTGLLGLDHRFCPACGAAQDPEARYFPSDEQKIAVEDHPFTGADRVCPACDTPNASTAEFCTACGCPLDEARAASRRSDKVLDDDETFEGESAKDARDEARQRHLDEEARRRARMAGQEPEPDAPEGTKKGGLMGIGLVGGCLGLVAIVVVGVVAFWLISSLWATTDQVTVTGHRWEREIAVEAFGPQKDSAWRDEVPRGAQIVKCTSKKRSTKKVPDGEDCNVRKVDNGDGTFSETKECEPRFRNEPVMDESCTYTINAWKKVRAEQAAGQDLTPRWPTVKLAKTGECVGCEREGKRTETYTVLLKDSEGQSHSCDLKEPAWRGLSKGQSVEATFGGLTGAIDCGSL